MRNGKNSKASTDATPNVAASSGNVFADLGVANPEIALVKAELVQHIRELITKRKLTQAKAADMLGLDQPKVSALVRGNVSGYSIDRLFRFLNALGQQVEINVRDPNGSPVEAERRLFVTHE
jgi:predicted XRE-type DNA-binding protein